MTSNNENLVKVTFVLPEGEKVDVFVQEGLSALEAAHQNNIPIEGACEGSLACSTCHVIVDEEYYSMLEDATDDEEDMLDLAFGVMPTSRLGCQIILTKKLNGIVLKVPKSTRNFK